MALKKGELQRQNFVAYSKQYMDVIRPVLASKITLNITEKRSRVETRAILMIFIIHTWRAREPPARVHGAKPPEADELFV